MSKQKRKGYTAFEDAVIKEIPSNLYVAKLLHRSAAAISVRRKRIKGAVVGKRYKNLVTLKKLFYTTYKEICKKFEVTTTRGSYTKKTPNQLTHSALSIPVMINGVITIINQNDKIELENGSIILYTKRKF